jgi:hypothetical protein
MSTVLAFAGRRYAIVQIVYICTHTVFALGNFPLEVFA